MSDDKTPPPGETPASGTPAGPGDPPPAPASAPPSASPLEVMPETTPLKTGAPSARAAAGNGSTPPTGQPGQALVVVPPAGGPTPAVPPPPPTPIDYAMPSSKSWIPSPALIRNLGCIFKMLFGFTVLLILGYVMLMALNPKARQWALQGTPQGGALPGAAGGEAGPGPTPFKAVNQILALPAQALAKTDDVVQANNARAGMLDGVIAQEEAAAKGGGGPGGRGAAVNPFLDAAKAASAQAGAPGTKAGPGAKGAKGAATEEDSAEAERAAQAARIMALQEKMQASGHQPAAKADAVRSTALATQDTPVLAPISLPGGITIQAASPEGAPPPSRAFLYWVVGLNISGINPPRLLINSRLVHEQQEVNITHGITFDRFDAARRLLYFRDKTGAVVTRSY